MTSVTSLLVGLFSILCLKQLQVVGVAESLHDGAYQSFTWRTLEVMSRFSDMTKPEQELLGLNHLKKLYTEFSQPPAPLSSAEKVKLSRCNSH